MIALWLPLWSLIGPDEGFVFLIIVFTFFITISVVVKFRSRNNMSCTLATRNFVAQECMALTKNPFQFRLSLLKHDQVNKTDNDQSVNDDDEVDKDVAGDSIKEKSNEELEKTKNNLKGDDKKVDELKQDNEGEINQTTEDELNEQLDNFKKGIRVDVLCKENYHLCYFWGVNIDQFHNFMRLNCKSFSERLFDGSLFDHAYLEKSEPKFINGVEQMKTFKLTCSDKVNPESLGESPRTCYPLVVILARPIDEGEEAQQSENDVVFMINVVHVKDRVCPLETNVITRLLKKRSGLTINLQTLYTPEFEDEPGGGSTAICVICQENLVSIALLPCRHTCTCLECFTKIDKCPLCRSYIKSYFMLKLDEQINNEQTDEQTKQDDKQDEKTTNDQSSTQQSETNTRPQNKNFLKKVSSKITGLFRS